MSDLSGKKFGKYQLRERLGRGGMADVYKAYQPGMDRFVAVKLLHGHLADSENFIERFKREAQSVGQLRHPNILQVIDFDVEDDVYFMVMEYIKGDTLKSYIQEKGALPSDEALQIAEQLADALDYAHSHKMVHRDIKPANVMFTDMSRKHPVLTDFGIARILSASGLTASGAFVGTPAYMPPEAGRSEPVDERSDIYSLGIMIYEMLTGKVPYDADTPFAVVMKHVNEPLPSIRQFNAELPEAVERILLKALSKDKADRFQTASDFKVALKKAREALPAQQPTARGDAFSTNVTGLNATPTAMSAKRALDTAETVVETVPPDEKTIIKNLPPVNAGRKYSIAKYGGALATLAIILVIGLFALTNDNNGDGTSSSDNQQANLVPSNTPQDVATTDTSQSAESTQPSIAPPSPPTEVAQGAVSETALDDEVDTDVSSAEDIVDQGFRQFNAENYEAAIEAFTAALEFNPENIDAYAGRGDSHWELENYEEAIVDYAQVIDRDPNNADALGNRSDAYLAIGDVDAALADINSAIELVSDDPLSYITRGWINVEMENLGAAETDFSRAIELAPELSDAYLGRGVVYHLLSESDLAISDLATAIDLGNADTSTLADMYYERAEVYNEIEEPDQALNDLNIAIELNPDAAYYYQSRAFIFLDQGDGEAAIEDLERAIAIEPLSSEYHRDLGDVFFDLERFGEALSQYQVYMVLEGEGADIDVVARVQRLSNDNDNTSAFEDRPRFVEFLPTDSADIIARANELENVRFQNGSDVALEQVTQALEEFPDNPILLALRSQLNLDIRQPEAALADAEAAQAANPEHPAGFLALSRYYFFSPEADYDRAFEFAENAFELAPEQPEVVIHYANALELVGRAAEAIEMYNRAEELGAQLIPVLSLRGNLQLATGAYEGAIEDFTRYLTYSDELGIRYNLLGAYLLANQPEQALLVAIDGFGRNNDPNYLANIAFIAYRAGDDVQATQWANDALVRDGNEFAAYYVLAMVAARNNDFDTAIEYFDLLAEQEDWQYSWPFLNQQFGHTLILDRARLAQMMGNDEQSEAFYAQVIDETYWYLPYVERGRWYLNQDRIDQGIDDFIQAIRLAEGNEALTQTIVQELADYGSEVVGRTVFHLILRDQPVGAVDLATRFLQTYPDDPMLLVGRANGFLRLEEFDSALEDIQTAIDNNPDVPIGYAGLVDYYRFTGQFDEMLATAEQAREIGSEDPDVLLAYARALRATETGEPVLVIYQAALDAGADPFTVLSERADYARNLGNFEQARVSMMQLAEQFPSFETVTNILQLLVFLGENDVAYDIAQQYADLDVFENEQPQFLSNLAFIAYLVEDNEQSQEWATTALEIDENLASAIYLQALLLARDEEFDQAIETFQQLETREPWEYGNGFIEDQFGHTLAIDLARIYQMMGDTDMAREYYQELPYNARLLVERAGFYIEIGETELARQDLLDAQNINTDTFNDEMLNDLINELLRSLGPAPASSQD